MGRSSAPRALAADQVSPSSLAPLRNPIFRLVWFATQISSVGSLMQTVAVSWLMVTISTSDLMVALVQASSTLPAFLLSIFAGAIADNFSRRKVMLAGRCLIAISSGMLTVLLATGFVHPWSILGLSFLAGCGIAFNGPAWQASVGDMVDRRDIPAAVMLISAGFNTIRAIGPAFGGIVVASFGPLIAVAVATLGNVAPLAAIASCKWKAPSSPLPREPITTAMYDGMRFATMSSEIRAVMTQGTLFGLASIGILALLPLVVRDQLGRGPLAYGILMAGFGTGAFLAGVVNSFFRHMLSQSCLIAAACVACAACSAFLALTHSVAAATVALGMGGAGWVTVWSELGTNVQLASPRWVVGRSLSIYYALTYGGIAAGSWLWGAVAETYSLSLAFVSSAGALLLVAAIGLVLPIGDAQHLELDPAENGFNAPELAVDLKPRSGPIVARIEYCISAENIDAFLDLMPERRVAQSRAGARHWNLQRDLQEPSHWIETFRTPTWTDYLRLNHRLTLKDNQLDERLSQLHSGERPRQLTLSIERSAGGSARKGSQPRPFISHPPLG